MTCLWLGNAPQAHMEAETLEPLGLGCPAHVPGTRTRDTIDEVTGNVPLISEFPTVNVPKLS